MGRIELRFYRPILDEFKEEVERDVDKELRDLALE